MSEYRYSISDTTDLANKLLHIQHRINIDVEITPSNLPVQSVVYSAPEVVITFNFPLVGRETYIVGSMVSFIFMDAMPGYTFVYNNLVRNPRDTMGGSGTPTHDHDLYSGYNVGSRFFIPSIPSAWICIDSTPGSAQWIELTGPVAPSPLISSSTTTLTKTFTSNKIIVTGDFMGQGTAGDSFSPHALLAGIDGIISSLCFSIRETSPATNIRARLWRRTHGHDPEPTELCVEIPDGNLETTDICEQANIPVFKLDLLAISIICEGHLGLGATASITIRH